MSFWTILQIALGLALGYFVGWLAVWILAGLALLCVVLFLMGVTKALQAKLTGAALKWFLATLGMGVVWFLFLPTLAGAILRSVIN